MYLLDRNHMGEFHAERDDNYQEMPQAMKGIMYGSRQAYFDRRLYDSSVNDAIGEFRFSAGHILADSVAQTPQSFPYPGTLPSISANGVRNGILWAIENGDTAVLRAYDAAGLHEVYNSKQAPGGRDHFGPGHKFVTLRLANGRVYAAVFGLLENARGR